MMTCYGSVRVAVLHLNSGQLQEGEECVGELQDSQQGLQLVAKDDPQMTSFIVPHTASLEFLEIQPAQFILKNNRDGFSYILRFDDSNQANLFKQRIQKSKEGNIFDERTDKSSADMYFHYYGLLMHQQNMMQDLQRTGLYYWAVASNLPDFQGKIVMDVGAGSGILSAFAAQAGARIVYAVEASQMAQYCARLLSKQVYGSCIKVINKKLEEIELSSEADTEMQEEEGVQKVDVLISEPMGTLLVNERMLETYITARKRFLKENGRMYPSVGQLFAALFQDDTLYAEISNKALFWCNRNFYGLDLCSLHSDALETYFRQVVIDSFNPGILLSTHACKQFDFMTLDEEDLHRVEFPFEFYVQRQCVVHGIASWFDVLFQGSVYTKVLSTAPGLAPTHWHQMRFVLKDPISVNEPSKISGSIIMIAHERQSYDITLNINRFSCFACQSNEEQQVPSDSRTAHYDLKDPYFRQFQQNWYSQPMQDNFANYPEKNDQFDQQQQLQFTNQEQQLNGSMQEYLIMEESGLLNNDQCGNTVQVQTHNTETIDKQ
eukprot:TRINITY_DN7348_c0_g2_i5.p1 TRINITY_DN7348_c0_g2~~TRINITY_DN7348_c0_g2_i5.p1  ORF type:complete len:548 (-),score=57.70 TRINITY_DN7348_c0_g2_i5:307-1950(-)